MPENVTYFFYGTLMDPAVASRVTVSSVTAARLRPAVLPDFHRLRVAGQTYPAIVPAPGHTVEGRLFRAATPEMQRRIAWFEDPDYQLREVVALGAGKMKVRAWVFVAGPEMKLSDEDWDFGAWYRQHRRPFLSQLDLWFRDYAPQKIDALSPQNTSRS